MTQINGTPKLQGVYRLKDESGFPIDMSFELAVESGWCVDWVEALVDAGRQCVFKFDALLEEIEMLDPGAAERAVRLIAGAFGAYPGGTFCTVCQSLYTRIWSDKPVLLT